MDVAADNTLPDPYTGSIVQPAYPWRGRITVTPAPGQPGTPDKTAAAARRSRHSSARPTSPTFDVAGESVVYSGPAEWSFRRLILHYAHLAAAAGGVDAFLIGSEMRGLTQVRDSASTYPFVAALADLAADVQSRPRPGTKVTYAADWSEYFGHQPADGSGDVYFHLDPLWSSPTSTPSASTSTGRSPTGATAAIMPTASPAPPRSTISPICERQHRAAARATTGTMPAPPTATRRSARPSPTAALGKPWVFRFKDIRCWWLEPALRPARRRRERLAHRLGAAVQAFWFTELGCPAVDKGANQPNVFVDPKSLGDRCAPYFSRAAVTI